MTTCPRLSLVTPVFFLMLGCSAPNTVAISAVTGDIEVSARLGKVTVNRVTDAQFVHAELTVLSTGKKLKEIDLNCIELEINDAVSSEINVDSIASVLNNPYPANADGQVEVPVYWAFPAQKVHHIQTLSDIKLRVKPDMGSPCFRY